MFFIRDGIPQFVRDSAYYYGEVSQPRMQQLLNECAGGDWQPPFERMIREMKYGLYHRRYALSEKRASWWPLLAFRPGMRVLDYGCGWGVMSFSYARRGGAEVTAYDLCQERLRFLQIRSASEGLSNITFVRGGDAPNLPFPDSSFDLAFLIGVLEWIPTSFEGSPLEVQKHFLREIARVLSPTGQLLLAIENRFNWYYFLGEPEDHTHIRFISLLPRPLANVYSRLRTGKPLRTLTHSNRAYKKLLRGAGFDSARTFLPVSDYRLFNRVLDPENPSTVSDFFIERGKSNLESLKNWAKKLAAPALGPSFFVVGRRKASVPSFLEELGQALSDRFSAGTTSGRARLTRYQVTRGDAILLGYKLEPEGGSFIVHIPLNDIANARCIFAQKTLRLLRESSSATVQSLVPTPSSSEKLNGIDYFVSSMLPGYPATRFLRDGKLDESSKAHAVSFLLQLRQRATADGSSESNWEDLVGSDLNGGLAIVERRLGISSHELREQISRQLSTRKWPPVFGHGDFWAGNLLLSDDGRKLLGVIDWDRAIPRGMPLLDLIHFLLYPKVEFEDRKLPDLVAETLVRGKFEDSDQPFVESYLHQMGIPVTEQLVRAFIVLYWLTNLGVSKSRGASESLFEEDWMRDFVAPAAGWLKDFLHGQSSPPVPAGAR